MPECGQLKSAYPMAAPLALLVGAVAASTRPGILWLPQILLVGWIGWQSPVFRGVPEAVWNFHIGGYQVCEKWLKDRKGRTLSKDDIAHYQKIVVSLSETIRLMKKIDQVIEQHGGWPGAFQASAYPKEEAMPLLKAAEPKGEYGKKD